MDVKLGVRTAETTAPLGKRVKMKAHDLLTSCGVDGVQLIAMSVYQRSAHKQLKSSKRAVRALPRSPIARNPFNLNFSDSAQCLMVWRWRLIGYFPI
jgi:hypothetical protein